MSHDNPLLRQRSRTPQPGRREASEPVPVAPVAPVVPVEPDHPPPPQVLQRPNVVVTPSIAQSANLIARGTTTLLTLDIHKVSDREEAVTSRLLQRILQETHIGVAFLSYAVKPATRAGAADCVRRIAERLSFGRPLSLPVIFTERKTGRGGKGERLAEFIACYNRSRAQSLETVIFIDDQSEIAADVAAYCTSAHCHTYSPGDYRDLDRFVWEECWF